MRELLRRISGSMNDKPTYGITSLAHANGLFNKFLLHACSVVELRNGSTIAVDGTRLVDVASLHVVLRAAIETYLTFEYVFNLAGRSFESSLRYLAWWREGLLSRQRMTADLPLASEVMARELEQLAENERKIRSNTVFDALSAKQQAQIIERGKWRPDGWGTIARKCGLSEIYSTKAYSFLSTYAHSESASVMQLSSMYQEDKEEHFSDTAVSLLLIVSAKMIRAMVSLMPDSGFCLSADDRSFVDRFSAGGAIGTL